MLFLSVLFIMSFVLPCRHPGSHTFRALFVVRRGLVLSILFLVRFHISSIPYMAFHTRQLIYFFVFSQSGTCFALACGATGFCSAASWLAPENS